MFIIAGWVVCLCLDGLQTEANDGDDCAENYRLFNECVSLRAMSVGGGVWLESKTYSNAGQWYAKMLSYFSIYNSDCTIS